MSTSARFIQILFLLFGVFGSLRAADQVEYVEPSKPYGASPFLKKVQRGAVNNSGPLLIPLITWAADGVTMSANNGLDTTASSPLSLAFKRPVQLEVIDDFNKQVENYITGKSPFLRGTADMIALVAGALKKLDPTLEPVVIFQLSTSTGADGFVAKDIASVTDLRGKTIVTQINGPHLSLIGNMLKDAGLSAHDVTIKFVNDIAAAPDWKPDGPAPATDPANVFRRDARLTGAACISPDIIALTGGLTGTVGSGQDGTLKGARAIFTTKTASNIIFDVYAVRSDFLAKNSRLVTAFRTTHVAQQEYFLSELANIARKKEADKNRMTKFVELCKPLAKIFNADEKAVNDYVQWVGNDLKLAGSAGNAEFFKPGNAVGFAATTETIQKSFFTDLQLIESPIPLAFIRPGATDVVRTPFAGGTSPPPQTDSGDSIGEKEPGEIFRVSFAFQAQTSSIKWQDYEREFARIHELVTKYGGAAVKLRGNVDNFFYNFVKAKKEQGKTSYERRDETGQFKKLPLPALEDIEKDADRLSQERADAVKDAYRLYLQEKIAAKVDDGKLGRFTSIGMGIKNPRVQNSSTPQAKNMRTEMVITAVESELPAGITADDLK